MIEKFGLPYSLIRKYDHWTLLLRPQQVTLGCMILLYNRNEVKNFSMVEEKAFLEFGKIIMQIEPAIMKLFAFDKINYLMLMMVDPEVHFHIIPRYSGERSFAGYVFKDFAWPGPPDLSRYNDLTDEVRNKLMHEIKRTLS